MKIGADGIGFIVEAGNSAPPDESGILVVRGDGAVIERVARFGNCDGQFMDPHWVAIGREGVLYVADFAGRRVQKFVYRVREAR